MVNFSLEGKTALGTGGTFGIGLPSVCAFAEAGIIKFIQMEEIGVKDFWTLLIL